MKIATVIRSFGTRVWKSRSRKSGAFERPD